MTRRAWTRRARTAAAVVTTTWLGVVVVGCSGRTFAGSGIGDGPASGTADGGVVAGDAGLDDVGQQSGCTGASTNECGSDGNVWRVDACGARLSQVERCAERHGACRAAHCGCSPGFADPDCDRCVVFADASAPAGGDGSTWSTASPDLSHAIELAAARVDPLTKIARCDVWVAEGTYYPTAAADAGVGATIQLRSGVDLYGGFAGDETGLADRFLGKHESILSGDIGAPKIDDDNSRHVVTSANDAILDGFTVTGGHAPTFDGAELRDDCGGGMYADGVDLHVKNSTFHDNAADKGAALCAHESTDVLENVTFDANRADNLAAIYLSEAHVVASGLTVTNNTSAEWAGGISATRTTLDVQSSDFGANHGGEGAAIELVDSTATIEDTTFHENVSFFEEWRPGGAISAENTDLDVRRCTFSKNDVGDSIGGAIDADGGHLRVEDSSFDANQAAGAGALSVANGVAEISRSSFTGHDASDYASTIAVEIYNSGKASLRVESSSFTDNQAKSGRGAVEVGAGVTATILDSVFQRNRARYAGALYVDRLRKDIGDATIVGCEFTDNEATDGSGGAVEVDGHATIANSTFFGNHASVRGGALFVAGEADMDHLSTSANAATSGGDSLACGFSRDAIAICTVANSIFWDENPNLVESPASAPTLGGALAVQFSDVRGGFPGAGNISSDPSFLDDASDLHLGNASPAIDAGSSSVELVDVLDLDGDGDVTEALPVDLDGAPRLQGVEPDMGAYEAR